MSFLYLLHYVSTCLGRWNISTKATGCKKETPHDSGKRLKDNGSTIPKEARCNPSVCAYIVQKISAKSLKNQELIQRSQDHSRISISLVYPNVRSKLLTQEKIREKKKEWTLVNMAFLPDVGLSRNASDLFKLQGLLR